MTKKSKSTVGRPQRQYDSDMDEISFFDTAEFKSFCTLVFVAIRKRTTLRQIRETLGDAFDERRIFDAIETLTGAGLIVLEWGAMPSRWTRKTGPIRTIDPQKPSNDNFFEDETPVNPKSFARNASSRRSVPRPDAGVYEEYGRRVIS